MVTSIDREAGAGLYLVLFAVLLEFRERPGMEGGAAGSEGGPRSRGEAAGGAGRSLPSPANL
jgi:hypothetical protein